MGETINDVESKHLDLNSRESHDSFATTTVLDENDPVKDGVRKVFLQQSVTILAFKDKVNNSTSPPDLLGPKVFFGFSSEDIPLVLGAVIGAAFVIVSSLMIITVWKCCCRMKISKKKKEYWLTEKGKENSHKAHPSVVQSNSVVFLGLKPTQVYDCHKLEKVPEENYPSKIISFPENEVYDTSRKIMIEPHPSVTSSPCADLLINNHSISEASGSICSVQGPQHSPAIRQIRGSPRSAVLRREPLQEQVAKGDSPFPCNLNIPNIVVHRDDSLRSSPAFYHRTFYSGTFDQHSLYSCDSQLGSEIDLKTCSLTWSNYSLRPMSTGDCYQDLFQRASFCKKSKNRMRSDIAAAIAMNRSQSSQLNKDTESLVENEVEIVFDERTTL